MMLNPCGKVTPFLRFHSQAEAAAKIAGGGVTSQCAWLTDQFGVRWMFDCERKN